MTPDPHPGGAGARVRTTWLATALALAALALALATQFSIGRDGLVPDARTGFVAAVVLLFAAAALLARGPAGRPLELPRWIEWRLVVVVIGIALLFRIYHFFSFPPGLWYDEAVNGTDAIDLMKHGNHLAVWRTSNNGHSTIYFYLLMVSFKLFGYTILAMRIVPVIAGLAAVAMFYVLARRLLGPLPALVATALMAVSRYAITFSRISWEASLEPLFEILSVYFFVRAMDTGRRRDWFMAGGSLAAGLYTYASFRIVPFVMAFFVLYVAATRWRDFRRHLPGLIFYFVSFLIVVTPLLQFTIRHTHEVTARQNEVLVFNQSSDQSTSERLWSNIRAVAKMMNVRGDLNARHNLPNEPMLDDISAALLVLGMGVAAWSIRDWRRGGVLGWYVLALVPSAITLTWENPSAIRTIGVIPPAFLLIGFAVDALHRALAGDAWRRGAFAAAMIVLLIGAAGINFHVLFDRQAKNEDVYDAFQSQTTRAAEAVADETGQAVVYFNDSFFGPATEVLDRGHTFVAVQPASNVPVPANIIHDATYILDTNQQALERYLVALYPGARADEVRDRFGRIDYIAVRVPRSAIASLHSAKADYTSSGSDEGSAVAVDESQLTHTWPEALPAGVRYPFTFSWSGVVRLNPAVDPTLLEQPMVGVTRVMFSSPGAVHLEIDGVGARDGLGSVAVDLPANLPAGLYRYRATATIDGDGVTKLEWQRSNGVRQVIPRDALVIDAPTEKGFLARHYEGSDWSGPVAMRSLEPFAGPDPRLQPKYSVTMDGDLAVTQAGDYGFAVNAEWPVAVLVDGKMVVDASEPRGWRRVEGTVSLTPGSHTITIKYASVGRTSFRVEWKLPGGVWQDFTGQEVTHPPIGPGGG